MDDDLLSCFRVRLCKESFLCLSMTSPAAPPGTEPWRESLTPRLYPWPPSIAGTSKNSSVSSVSSGVDDFSGVR